MAEHGGAAAKGGDHDAEGGGGVPVWAFIPFVLVVLGVGFVFWSGSTTASGTSQANVEFWFRQLYDLWARLLHLDPTTLREEAARLWVIITMVGYVLTVVGLFVVAYCYIRLYELRAREHHEFEHTITPSVDGGINPRILHIHGLMESQNPNDWRQAILEADIMLDEVVTKNGYQGIDLGEKLKSANTGNFATLPDAWEAHKVRNQIAHEGSTFDLSPTLAQRTIARYDSVFREFGEM